MSADYGWGPEVKPTYVFSHLTQEVNDWLTTNCPLTYYVVVAGIGLGPGQRRATLSFCDRGDVTAFVLKFPGATIAR